MRVPAHPLPLAHSPPPCSHTLTVTLLLGVLPLLFTCSSPTRVVPCPAPPTPTRGSPAAPRFAHPSSCTCPFPGTWPPSAQRGCGGAGCKPGGAGQRSPGRDCYEQKGGHTIRCASTACAQMGRGRINTGGAAQVDCGGTAPEWKGGGDSPSCAPGIHTKGGGRGCLLGARCAVHRGQDCCGWLLQARLARRRHGVPGVLE
jgi:hypothetical protein